MKCPHCNGELPPDKNCICQDPAPDLREAAINMIKLFTLGQKDDTWTAFICEHNTPATISLATNLIRAAIKLEAAIKDN